MAVHVMLDLETWGLTPGSHIRSIGAVVFDPGKGDLGAEFYCNVNSMPCHGLTVDPETVRWWHRQSDEARAVLTRRPADLLIALTRLSRFLGRVSRRDSAELRIWAHGPHFDCSIIEAAYRAIDRPIPWHYRSPRDCRTMLEAAAMNPITDFPPVGTMHNALDDAKSQALGVLEAFHRLRVSA